MCAVHATEAGVEGLAEAVAEQSKDPDAPTALLMATFKTEQPSAGVEAKTSGDAKEAEQRRGMPNRQWHSYKFKNRAVHAYSDAV